MPFDWSAILDWLVLQAPVAGTVLMILGGLVVVGTLYVRLTPNLEDDAFLAKLEAMPILGDILKVIVRFSPFQRKEVSSLMKKK